MSLNFVKKSVYIQKLEADKVGEDEREVAVQDEWTASDLSELRKKSSQQTFKSLSEQLADNARLRDSGIFDPQMSAPVLPDSEAEAPPLLLSTLVDNPKSRQEEAEDVADFKAEQSEQVLVRRGLAERTRPESPPRRTVKDEVTLSVRVATRKRRSSVENDRDEKKTKIENLLGEYDSDSDGVH